MHLFLLICFVVYHISVHLHYVYLTSATSRKFSRCRKYQLSSWLLVWLLFWHQTLLSLSFWRIYYLSILRLSAWSVDFIYFHAIFLAIYSRIMCGQKNIYTYVYCVSELFWSGDFLCFACKALIDRSIHWMATQSWAHRAQPANKLRLIRQAINHCTHRCCRWAETKKTVFITFAVADCADSVVDIVDGVIKFSWVVRLVECVSHFLSNGNDFYTQWLQQRWQVCLWTPASRGHWQKQCRHKICG